MGLRHDDLMKQILGTKIIFYFNLVMLLEKDRLP